jgi:tubulin polyglutamylase TTLL6/13
MARFCTEPYADPTPANLENLYSHLTNYSLNKKNENFVADSEHSHKRPMSSILEEVERRGFDVPKLKSQIDEIIRQTIASVHPFLANSYRSVVPMNDGKSRCFELLGFDILLDKRARPWLLEVNFMPMLDIDTNFDKELKFSVIKGVFTILGLSPSFKAAVMKRDRAETDKRITGSTSLPICRIFDPEAESKAAAESTNWRQLYPLLEGVESAIESSLAMAKTTTVASIENSAFRVRQKAVQAQIQEMDRRDHQPVRKPTITKFFVPPMIYARRQHFLPLAAPAMDKSPPPPSEEPQTPVDEPPTPVDEAPVSVEELPREPTPAPTPRVVVAPQDIPAHPSFPGFTPILFDDDEEAERLQNRVSRAAASRAAGIDRAVGAIYRIKPKGATAPPMVKTKQSLLSIPVVKAPIIYQIP